jgi:hypothetical protein
MTDEIPASDLVWNRACEEFDITPGMPRGDAALAALLLCHGMAMNGGLPHAVEGLEAEELARAIAGYRFFGLDEVADLVADVARQAADLDPSDLDAADQLEVRSNERFYALVPDDDSVAGAFQAHFREHPEDYAPP